MNHTSNTLAAVAASGSVYWSADILADGSGLIYIAILIAGTALLTVALCNTRGK